MAAGVAEFSYLTKQLLDWHGGVGGPPLSQVIAVRIDEGAQCEECSRLRCRKSERHLRSVLNEYIDHYNAHRPNRARGQRPPDHDEHVVVPMEGRIEHHNVLGGAINAYRRAAWLGRRNPSSNHARELLQPRVLTIT
ncbi:hypothetical protein ACWEPL_59610 [Nonomuraea sp. NPDC004186]